jgi:hypothetical protein
MDYQAEIASLVARLDATQANERRLIDELAALRKDAERYRWLLKNYARGDGYDAIDAALNDGKPEIQLSPAIDAAIDAAMQASVTSASA